MGKRQDLSRGTSMVFRGKAAELVVAALSRPRPHVDEVRAALDIRLAKDLSNAIAADELNNEGFDLSAGLFGVNVSAFIRRIADEILTSQSDRSAE